MLSVSYASKNANISGKTSEVLRGGVSGANTCYVLAHCGVGVGEAGWGGGGLLDQMEKKTTSALD